MSSLLARAKTGFALAALTGLLLWPAMWNGAPLFYYDSVDYLEMPFTSQLPVFRTAPYGWLQWFARLTTSLWLPLILQALMASTMMWISARSFVRGLSPFLFLIGAGLLCVITGWPWYVSQIMADSVTGAVLFAAVAMLCGSRLSAVSRWTLIGLTAIGISFHISHLAVVCGLLVAGALAVLVMRFTQRAINVRLGDLAIAIVLAMTIAVTANFAATGRAFLFRDPANLRLALFVETGLVQRYLDDVCPGNEKASLLCPYRNRMPTTANAYLWNTFGPFHDMGGWQSEAHRQEAKAIIREILHRYPADTVFRHGRAAIVQFGLVETGDGIRPMHWHLEKPIGRYYPDSLTSFLTAHQQRGIDFQPYAARDVWLYWLAMLGMVLLAMARWRAGPRWPAAAALFVFLALAGNAVVCGALSNPNHRYQGRIAFLPLLLVMLSGADLALRWRQKEAVTEQGATTVA